MESRVDVTVENRQGGPTADGKRHPNTCPRCHSHYREDELEQTLRVCPQCGHHFPVRARERIAQLADRGTFAEQDAGLRSDDPLTFFDLRAYTDRLAEAEVATGLGDALIAGAAAIERRPCELAVMDFAFMGGSMGSTVGEKFARACDRAVARHVPLVCVTASGGARMQEGILSLMQLPKTVCAVDELHEARCAFLSVMTRGRNRLRARRAPCLHRPARRAADDAREAPRGFRPGRVERPLRPHRRDRPARRAPPVRGPAPRDVREPAVTDSPSSQAEQLKLKERLAKLRDLPLLRGVGVSGEMSRLKRQLDRLASEPSEDDVWNAVELARHQDRPYTLDYVERMCDDFVELHGDRSFSDDPAIVAGLARFAGRTVVLVGHQKGRDIRERTHRNFGMTYPEGYRKAMRAMEIADRHRFPVLTLVDTPGAYPGVTAEQHGQGGWIARCQLAMARLRVPSVTCIIGEGGSGGAVAIAVADRVLMQQNAIYSVISPEGCAAILWRDAGEAKKAAAAFKPDARHCVELGVVDAIVPEPPLGAHTDHDQAAALLSEGLRVSLADVDPLDPEERRRLRRRRFRAMGIYLE
jgi:acetyl-CoA carboxylase carboxyl transferase alpha subunit